MNFVARHCTLLSCALTRDKQMLFNINWRGDVIDLLIRLSQ